MKWSVILTLLISEILLCGCVSHKPAASTTSTTTTPPAPQLIVTLDHSLDGKVVSYDSIGHFVVLSFPVGPMPALGETLYVYRGGLKMGELKVSGPQRDNDIVADIVTGVAQVGDDVHDQ